MEAKALYRYARISARKARTVRCLIMKKEAKKAMQILDSVPKKASGMVRKLLASALSNASNKGPDGGVWYVKNFIVEEGPRMKRLSPAPMGRGFMIKKRFSHLTIVLEEGEVNGTKSKSDKL